MTIYQLKEIINSKYNRKDTTRYERSVPQILSDLGVANTSDFVLQALPEDFTYLPDLFC